MTFHDRLTALDHKLNVSTSETVATTKTRRAEEEQRNRLEGLEEVEEEQQNILHDMGMGLYDTLDLQKGKITVDLNHQQNLARQEEREGQSRELQKIRYQQTQIMREHKQVLCASAPENQESFESSEGPEKKKE